MEKESSTQETTQDPLRWQHSRISLGLKLLLAVGAVLLVFDQRYQAAATTVGILVIAFLPYFMNNLLHFRIPAEFETLSVVFIYVTLFLGEVHGFYVKFWWWDLVLHASSGLLGGMIGFLLVYVLNNNKRINLNLTPVFIALFAFMFAMGMGALWEIFEFTLDTLFNLNTQRGSLRDTMSDLIVDCVGALIMSMVGYYYLSRKGKDHFLKRIIRRFVSANPRIFRKQKNSAS